MRKRVVKRKPRGLWLHLRLLLRAALVACAFVLGAMAVLTLLLYAGVPGEGAIPVFNSLLKVLGAALAGLVIARGCQEKRFLMGALAAMLYYTAALGCCLLLLGEYHLHWHMAGDLLICATCGALTATVIGSLKKKDA